MPTGKEIRRIPARRAPRARGRLVFRKSSGAKARFTMIVPAALDLNLEMLAKFLGRSKMDVASEAIAELLKDYGIDPLHVPVMSWQPPGDSSIAAGKP